MRVCLFCCCFLYVLDLVCVLTRFPPWRLGGPWAPGPFPIFTSMGTEYLQKRFPMCLNRVRGKNDSAGPATLPIPNQDLNTTHQLTHTHIPVDFPLLYLCQNCCCGSWGETAPEKVAVGINKAIFCRVSGWHSGYIHGGEDRWWCCAYAGRRLALLT